MVDNSVTHSSNTDDRSKWFAESTNALSIDDIHNNIQSTIKIYPNPASNSFKIQLNNIDNASITIYNILGKQVYHKPDVKESIKINISNRFETGVYLIKVTDSNQKVYYNKLIIN